MELLTNISEIVIGIFLIFCVIILLTNIVLAIQNILVESKKDTYTEDAYLMDCFVGEIILVCLGIIIVFLYVVYHMVQ